MRHLLVCNQGHETELPANPEFGHVLQCPVCKEICVKVYPQGGGREFVVIPPETAKFHRLVPEYQDHEEGG